MTSAGAEERWIDGSRRGDPGAFESLYRTYVRQVYGICRRLLDDNEDAEDMTQRAFLRAWERIDTFRGESRFGTWLRRIAVHLILDERRSMWRRTFDAEVGDTAEEMPAPAEAPGAALDLERAVGTLPPGPRRVLVLHDIEGYTHVEIAEMLGVTAGTTKTQLFRARRALKGILR